MFRRCLAVFLLSVLTACSKSDSGRAAAQAPDAPPPHGGTSVSLGQGEYHLELVRDAAAGRLDAYVLDGEMEDFVRIAAPSFEISVSFAGQSRSLQLHAVANPATGETVGDTSQFEGRADWLKTTDAFEAVLDQIDIRGAVFSAVAFNFPKGGDPPPPLRVTTLSTVLTEIATQVGGSDVTVTGILQPGVDPHTFEPAPSDLQGLAQADLVLASGLGLENYLDKIAVNSGTHGKIMDAGRVLGDSVLSAEGRGRREPDPHWWHSIAATVTVTRRVAAELGELRPAAALRFRARADAYCGRLAALDRWTRAAIAMLPPVRRQLVTTHNAFGWFARDYGFTAHAISGLSPEAEPDARDFARLAEFIRREHVPAIFTESDESPKLAEALARETGARLGGSLYADGLVPEPDGATYEAMFRHNVTTIVAALK